MNWLIWKDIEDCLRENGVLPILAIVPRNVYSRLEIESPRSDFWKRVRKWQEWGWSIALHGYEHRVVTYSGGILGISRKSEFAGAPYKVQLRKLKEAIAIFDAEGIKIKTWIAPWHSFDAETIRALKELEFDCISDGFALAAHRDEGGMWWIPQQLWRFRRLPFGLWTVCHHHNWWKEAQLNEFKRNVVGYRNQITSLEKVKANFTRENTIFDGLLSQSIYIAIRLRWLIRDIGT